MAHVLVTHRGGCLVRPAKILCDRADGGHLVVDPPRPVWERSALTPDELVAWSFLVAASGQAMLECLPQLAGGCLNYWEAGNWALNEQAAPAGAKDPQVHRRVHLHLFGRSPHARHPDWRWGESPRFPDYVDSERWSAQFAALTDHECDAVARRASELLATRYRLPGAAS